MKQVQKRTNCVLTRATKEQKKYLSVSVQIWLALGITRAVSSFVLCQKKKTLASSAVELINESSIRYDAWLLTKEKN